MRPDRRDAYQLFHDGALVFSAMEEHGIRMDVGYLETAIEETGATIRQLVRELQDDPLWGLWRGEFGEGAKLSSRQQLGRVVYGLLGHPVRSKTEKGHDSTDESAFRGIDLPFLPKYFRLQKLQKARKTYLQGILAEVQDGRLHPSFNLHTTVTYRSSGSEPNFHNIPARDREIMQLIRRAFLADEGHHLVEVDLSGAEVRVAYCYHLDPTMRSYLLDPSTDMHRDAAAELFCLEVDYLKQNAAWAKRTVRDWAKNRFVFPQFYGSVFFQCATHLWEAVTESGPDGLKHRLPDGKPILDHLRDKGVRSLGDCDPRRPPLPGTFEYHVARIERSFWNDRFPQYTEWKRRWLRDYEARGCFDTLTGFRCRGQYSRNQVINFPVQGSAFHVLLWSLIRLHRWLRRHRMRTRIIGQIHDSVVATVPPEELDDYLEAAHHYITVACPGHWDWITIPIEVEAEVSDVGATWADKRAYKRTDGGSWVAA